MKPSCVVRQRDELRDRLEQMVKQVEKVKQEECALTVERALLSVDGTHGVDHSTAHIARRVVEHCAAAVRGMK
jgi:copper chaperone CopZ